MVWGILFGFPILFTPGGSPLSSVYIRTILPLLFTAFIFYINYFLLIDRTLFKNQVVLFIILNLVLILICTWGLEGIKDWMWAPHRGGGGGGPKRGDNNGWRNYLLFRSAFSLALTVGVSVAARIVQRWMRLETERKSLETEQLKSTLAHLQYQIQPHFFFNSLNNIYSLIDISPEKAKDSPLLFIPLVENAFKHGVSASQASFIFIKMRIEENQIIFWVENTNFPKNDSDQGGSGIGIENLKQRLELLYPSRYEFKQAVQDGIFRSDLKIVIG